MTTRILAGGILLLALACATRLERISYGGLNHPEIYVPNISLPDVSEPKTRSSPVDVLTGTFSADTHPPGYYLGMWAWTKLFGTGLETIRLPSLLAGVGSVLLVVILGYQLNLGVAGWIGGVLLAMNGLHVYWSTIARMYAISCFLGLLATVLLVWMTQSTQSGSSKPPSWLAWVYAAVLLAGVSTHIFFWLILGTHLLWTLVNSTGLSRPPQALRAQASVLIVGSILLASAAYQSGMTPGGLDANIWPMLDGYLSFGFLAATRRVPESSGFHFGYAISSQETEMFNGMTNPSAFVSGVTALAPWLFLPALVLLGIGMRTMEARQAIRDTGAEGGPQARSSESRWTIAWLGMGAFTSVAIVGFVFMAERYTNPLPSLALTRALIPLPLVLAGAAVAIAYFWQRLPSVGTRIRVLRSPQSLIWWLALMPLLVLVVINFFMPIMNQRGTTLLIPYLFLAISAGIVEVTRRGWAAAIMAAVMVPILIGGTLSYREMALSGVNFQKFSAAWQPYLADDDLIYFTSDWYSSPLYYYFDWERYRIRKSGFAQFAADYPGARIWTLEFYQQNVPDDAQEYLSGLSPEMEIHAGNGTARLYLRPILQLDSAGGAPATEELTAGEKPLPPPTAEVENPQ